MNIQEKLLLVIPCTSQILSKTRALKRKQPVHSTVIDKLAWYAQKTQILWKILERLNQIIA